MMTILFSLLSGGGQTRTDDLWVMSPTSYHCSTPRYFDCKDTTFIAARQAFTTFFGLKNTKAALHNICPTFNTTEIQANTAVRNKYL